MQQPEATRKRYLAIQIGLGLVLSLIIIGGAALGRSAGTELLLPEAIESLSPVDGAQVPHQYPVVIDMAPGYAITLSVRQPNSGVWEQIPPSEVQFEPATGVFTWAPSPQGFLGDLGSGDHRLRVDYRGTGTKLDAGSYEWTFRTY